MTQARVWTTIVISLNEILRMEFHLITKLIKIDDLDFREMRQNLQKSMKDLLIWFGIDFGRDLII